MNRSNLAEQFGTPDAGHWKTIVLEAHPGEATAAEYLSDVFGDGSVRATEDMHLHQIELGEKVKISVDDIEGRFWSFHSTSPNQDLRQAIHSRVNERHDLDYVWLPSEHLRHALPGRRPSRVRADFKGSHTYPADDVQDVSISVRGEDPDAWIRAVATASGYPHALSVTRAEFPLKHDDFGSVQQAIDRRAHFVARGDSFALHQRVVADVIKRYRAFVEAVEDRACQFSALPEGGGTLQGAPIEIAFSKPQNLPRLFDELFSSRDPFRLWGLESVDESYGECDAVDLHVFSCLRIEAQPEFLRIRLHAGACGNTVARLVSNLQQRVDGALWIVDPDLQALLAPAAAVTANEAPPLVTNDLPYT